MFDLQSAIAAEAEHPPAFAVVSPFSAAYPHWQKPYGADHLALVCACVHLVSCPDGKTRATAIADVSRLTTEQVERIALRIADEYGDDAAECLSTIREEGQLGVDIQGAVIAPTLELGRALSRQPQDAGSN